MPSIKANNFSFVVSRTHTSILIGI